uniref:Uncharacterized protein n=1 Tax=Romanomermis culicivorax TaxID=13658 RepID=A0A915LBT7_ROMCU
GRQRSDGPKETYFVFVFLLSHLHTRVVAFHAGRKSCVIESFRHWLLLLVLAASPHAHIWLVFFSLCM